VRAFNAADPSGYSNISTAVAQSNIPAAPSNCVASPVGPSSITITWTDASNNEDGFYVQRKAFGESAFTDRSPLQSPSTNTGTSKTYTDTGLTNNSTYTYRVRAFNTAGSAVSNESQAATQSGLPGAPSSLQAIAVSATRVELSWLDNATDETGFFVQRNIQAGAFSDISGQLNPNTNAFADVTAQPGIQYGYRVRAINSFGNSPQSNIATVTTPTGVSPPNLLTMTPTSIPAGATAFQLIVTGTDFATNSVIRWNSTVLATSFISSVELRATIQPSLVANPGTATITVI
jgi:hypothetical protein